MIRRACGMSMTSFGPLGIFCLLFCSKVDARTVSAKPLFSKVDDKISSAADSPPEISLPFEIVESLSADVDSLLKCSDSKGLEWCLSKKENEETACFAVGNSLDPEFQKFHKKESIAKKFREQTKLASALEENIHWSAYRSSEDSDQKRRDTLFGPLLEFYEPFWKSSNDRGEENPSQDQTVFREAGQDSEVQCLVEPVNNMRISPSVHLSEVAVPFSFIKLRQWKKKSKDFSLKSGSNTLKGSKNDPVLLSYRSIPSRRSSDAGMNYSDAPSFPASGQNPIDKPNPPISSVVQSDVKLGTGPVTSSARNEPVSNSSASPDANQNVSKPQTSPVDTPDGGAGLGPATSSVANQDVSIPSTSPLESRNVLNSSTSPGPLIMLDENFNADAGSKPGESKKKSSKWQGTKTLLGKLLPKGIKGSSKELGPAQRDSLRSAPDPRTADFDTMSSDHSSEFQGTYATTQRPIRTGQLSRSDSRISTTSPFDYENNPDLSRSDAVIPWDSFQNNPGRSRSSSVSSTDSWGSWGSFEDDSDSELSETDAEIPWNSSDHEGDPRLTRSDAVIVTDSFDHEDDPRLTRSDPVIATESFDDQDVTTPFPTDSSFARGQQDWISKVIKKAIEKMQVTVKTYSAGLINENDPPLQSSPTVRDLILWPMELSSKIRHDLKLNLIDRLSPIENTAESAEDELRSRESLALLDTNFIELRGSIWLSNVLTLEKVYDILYGAKNKYSVECPEPTILGGKSGLTKLLFPSKKESLEIEAPTGLRTRIRELIKLAENFCEKRSNCLADDAELSQGFSDIVRKLKEGKEQLKTSHETCAHYDDFQFLEDFAKRMDKTFKSLLNIKGSTWKKIRTGMSDLREEKKTLYTDDGTVRGDYKEDFVSLMEEDLHVKLSHLYWEYPRCGKTRKDGSPLYKGKDPDIESIAQEISKNMPLRVAGKVTGLNIPIEILPKIDLSKRKLDVKRRIQTLENWKKEFGIDFNKKNLKKDSEPAKALKILIDSARAVKEIIAGKPKLSEAFEVSAAFAAEEKLLTDRYPTDPFGSVFRESSTLRARIDSLHTRVLLLWKKLNRTDFREGISPARELDTQFHDYWKKRLAVVEAAKLTCSNQRSGSEWRESLDASSQKVNEAYLRYLRQNLGRRYLYLVGAEKQDWEAPDSRLQLCNYLNAADADAATNEKPLDGELKALLLSTVGGCGPEVNQTIEETSRQVEQFRTSEIRNIKENPSLKNSLNKKLLREYVNIIRTLSGKLLGAPEYKEAVMIGADNFDRKFSEAGNDTDLLYKEFYQVLHTFETPLVHWRNIRRKSEK